MFKKKYWYTITTTGEDGVSLDTYALGLKKMTEKEAMEYIDKHTKDWPMLFIVNRSARPIEKFIKNQMDLKSLVEQVSAAVNEATKEVSTQMLDKKEEKKLVN